MRAMIDVSLVFTGTRGLTFLAAGHTHVEILGDTDDGVELGRTCWR